MKSVQIVFRGTEEYRRELQQAALDRGIKVQELLEESVKCYLAKPHAKVIKFPGKYARHLALAESVLSGNDWAAIGALTKLLDLIKVSGLRKRQAK